MCEFLVSDCSVVMQWLVEVVVRGGRLYTQGCLPVGKHILNQIAVFCDVSVHTGLSTSRKTHTQPD